MPTVNVTVTDQQGHSVTAGVTIAISSVNDMAPSWWQNSANTGVTPGTVLTPFTGTLTSSANNQVIQNMTGAQITVAHQNVTVRNCRLTTGLRLNTGHTIVERCDLGPSSGMGGGIAGNGIIVMNFGGGWEVTFRNCRAHNANDILRVAQIHAYDSWFYLPADAGNGSHSDTSQQTGGQSTEVCEFHHCLLENSGPSRNSCFEYPFQGLLNVRRSYLRGGQQTVHIGSGRRLRLNDVIIDPDPGGVHFRNESGGGVVEEWVNVRNELGVPYPRP